MSKDNTILEYAWALQPLATLVPSLPIHQNSLFAVLSNMLSESPEGVVWLVVYDLKTLLQLLGAAAGVVRLAFNFAFNKFSTFLGVMRNTQGLRERHGGRRGNNVREMNGRCG